MTAQRRRDSAFAAASLWRDWRMLCEEIGERRAGSEAERRAADFVAASFAASGLENLRLESFPCAHRIKAETEVHEPTAGGWRRVEATSLVGAPGTPGGNAVTGRLVWAEMPESGRRIKPGAWRGCIVAMFGPLPTEVSLHRRVVAADPLALIQVDERLPFPWTKNDGVYPYWAERYGMPPTVTVPYPEAWRWRRQGIPELRVRVALEQPRGESQNVIAEWRGQSPQAPALVVTAHHDTQCGNPGADDNASGVVCLLALARALPAVRLRRTIRLISFGAEEQLSVGSAAYVRRHSTTPRQVGLALNFDSVASPLGHWVLSIAGSTGLRRFAAATLAAHGLDVRVAPEITPFSDHFAFNRAGVPSLWFMRTNSAGGRWQHHSHHDNLENVSAEEVQRLLLGVHPLLLSLAGQKRWPFAAALPRDQAMLARRLGRELFG